MKKIQNFKIFRQKYSDDCWIASTKMVVDYLKKTDYSYDKLLRSSKEIPEVEKGSGEGIAKLLIKAYPDLIFKYDMGVLGTIKDLMGTISKNIDLETPVIIGMPGHAVVVIGYDGDKAIIADPYTGRETLIASTEFITDICHKF